MLVLGSVSRTVFPAGFLVGFGGREPVAEGDGESVDRRLPPHGPPGFPFAGGVQGPGDQVQVSCLSSPSGPVKDTPCSRARATRSAASFSSGVGSFLILFVTSSSVAVITAPFPPNHRFGDQGRKHRSSDSPAFPHKAGCRSSRPWRSAPHRPGRSRPQPLCRKLSGRWEGRRHGGIRYRVVSGRSRPLLVLASDRGRGVDGGRDVCPWPWAVGACP
jgi:hypothetical protein